MDKRIVKINRYTSEPITRMTDEEFLADKIMIENPHLKEGFIESKKPVTYCEDRDYVYVRIQQQSLIKRAF